MRVMPSRRAITLTLQHQAGPLQHQIDRLMDAWKNLRRQQSWKAAVKGGFYSLEITRNNQNGMWHPHLHVIVTGSYYDQKVLSRAWDKASGGSSITYIQAIHDIEKTGNYISKYVTKPDVIAEWKSTVLIEYADAIRGRRLFHTFGTMHNLIPANLDAKLIESKGDTYALPCHIIEGVKEGLPECEEVLFAARAMPKKWRVAFGVDYQLTFEELDETPVPNDDEMHSLLMSATLALDKKAEKPMPEPPTTTHTQLDLDLKTKIPSPARMI